MKKLILSLFVLSLSVLTSCKVGCTVEDVVVRKLGPAIAVALQCSNVPQIDADIQSVLDKSNICSVSAQGKTGGIAMLVCPIVAQGAVNLLGSQIPPMWGCNPAVAKGDLLSAITAACSLLPF